MYRNLDECLRDVYRFGALRIEPRNNTASVMEWVKNGVMPSKSSLTQAEWHANAAMIQARIGRLLTRFERAAIECAYREMRNLWDVALMVQSCGVSGELALLADIAANIYSNGEYPRRVEVMDRHDISKASFYRMRQVVNDILAKYERLACDKLNEAFRGCGIIGMDNT